VRRQECVSMHLQSRKKPEELNAGKRHEIQILSLSTDQLILARSLRGKPGGGEEEKLPLRYNTDQCWLRVR
jgi:hypothetical protein